MYSEKGNIAFVDGQNVHMATKTAEGPWSIDLRRFRIYLEKKYNIRKAYYFLGFLQNRNQDLYDEIQEAGFILKFKKHNSEMLGKKKGNVDTDIVFKIMKKVYRKEKFNKIVLVSGDGDYIELVDFLIEENRFEKILFPNQKNASSLYKGIELKYRANLSHKPVVRKIGVQKEKGSLGS